MATISTYIDSGVLISAARSTGPMGQRALGILDDPNRAFASSIYVQLEVLPKAIYYNLKDQVAFYEEFFQNVTWWANDPNIPKKAFIEASKTGLNALDALHVVSARSVKAKEFITTERPTTLLHNTRLVKVISIY